MEVGQNKRTYAPPPPPTNETLGDQLILLVSVPRFPGVCSELPYHIVLPIARGTNDIDTKCFRADESKRAPWRSMKGLSPSPLDRS